MAYQPVNGEITAQGLNNNFSFILSQIANVSGSPKGTYATLSALQTAFPNGAVGIYVVTADGKWYYWNGSAWTVGGTYQSTGIAMSSIGPEFLSFSALTGIKGKNLFNKSAVISNMYVANNNGQLTTSPNGTHNASEYIPITPATAYKISGTFEQGAFYDANKVYISGFSSASSVSVSPANAYYIRLTVLNSQLDVTQLEQGSTATSYEPFGTRLDINTIKTPIPESKLTLDQNIMRGTPSKNLFNKDAVTIGYYVVSGNGSLSALAGYNASEYIPVLPNTDYRLSGTNEQLAFYDTNKQYISGLSFGGQLTKTPANAAFLRLSVKDSQLSSVQLEKGTAVTPYIKYGPKVGEDQLGFNVPKTERVTKTVKKDGTGDYLSPKLANDAITDASATKIYDLVIYPGEYTEIGWKLKPYINMVGTNYKTCCLKGELPDDATDAQIDNTSTVWFDDTNDISYLTITAKNMRYAVHDESSNTKKDWSRKLKKCRGIHYGNEGARKWRSDHPESGMLPSKVWVSECAYGMGHSSGSTLVAEDCEFIAPFAPFSVHNNAKFDKPCLVILRRCEIIKTNGQFKYALRLQSLGSGTNDMVILEGCRINGDIEHNDDPWLGDPTASSHKDFTIEGFGNSEVPYTSDFDTGEKDRPNFKDEYNYFTAQSTITKGQAVCFVSDYKTVKPMNNTDDVSLFAGIAIENIAAGSIGKVKIKGFVSKSDLYNFSGTITFGNKYGIDSNGSLVVNSNAVVIGFDANNVKII